MSKPYSSHKLETLASYKRGHRELQKQNARLRAVLRDGLEQAALLVLSARAAPEKLNDEWFKERSEAAKEIRKYASALLKEMALRSDTQA